MYVVVRNEAEGGLGYSSTTVQVHKKWRKSEEQQVHVVRVLLSRSRPFRKTKTSNGQGGKVRQVVLRVHHCVLDAVMMDVVRSRI